MGHVLMTDVEQWDPRSISLGDNHRAILSNAWRERTGMKLPLTQEDLETMRVALMAKAGDWKQFAEPADDNTIINWIKVLVLCEEQYSGFDCGAKSPVIPLVGVLRQRGTYSREITSWIKENSSNRFLPYGSLLDRL